jgi:serine/threonine-protein kinase
MLRHFPAALKLYDRALDIVPNHPDVMAFEASIYQAQGDLKEAAKLLTNLDAQNVSGTINNKVNQLRLERNYAEAIRLLQARLAQFHYQSHVDKAYDQVALSVNQRLAGDIASSKVIAEQARTSLDSVYRDQPHSALSATVLSQACTLLGEKSSAVKLAEDAIVLGEKDSEYRAMYEEPFALVQMMFGENNRAISTLTRVLQTPHNGWFLGPAPVTPALLRLDPIWDPLRADPAFQKLCEEKQPPATQ